MTVSEQQEAAAEYEDEPELEAPIHQQGLEDPGHDARLAEAMLAAEAVTEEVLPATAPARRRRQLPRRQPRRVTIDVYDGYGTSTRLAVRGRLYFKRRVDEVEESDSRFRNLVNTSRRFMTNEAEKVWVQVQLRDHLQEVLTDAEGLFTAVFENISDIPYGVHSVTVSLASRNRRRMQADPGVGHFILHHLDSDRVSIISDIDDTILLTEATSKVRLLKNVFLSNYKTQTAVEGMSDIYRAIHYGPLGDGYDATHYVSSSPDNLYSRINMFLDYRKFPSGSIDLKNIGLRKGSDSLFDHEKYKLGRIQRILETYPNRRFVLFGDSGEHDPEIYRKLARERPAQIVAIYIHNVTGDNPYNTRFEGQMLFTSIDKVRRDLLKRGLVYSD